MAIILPIERKSLKARLTLGIIYLVLTLGAITMIWPFLIMLTGAATNRYDYHRYSPVLRSLFNDEDRFMRVLASYHATFPREQFPEAPKHWGSWTAIARDPAAVEAFTKPWLAGLADPATCKRWGQMADDYAAFNRSYSVTNSVCAFDERDVAPFVEDYFKTIDALNATWRIRYQSFYGIRMRAQQRMPMHHPDWDWPMEDPKNQLYQNFKAFYKFRADPTQEPYTRTTPYCIRPLWQRWLTKNHLKGTTTFFPPHTDDPLWKRFIREAYPKRLMRITVTPELQAKWVQHVQAVCKTPEGYAKLTGAPQPAALTNIPLLPYENSSLWRNFIPQVPLSQITVSSPEADWAAFLKSRYGDLARAAAIYAPGQTLTAWEEINLPFAEAFAITFHRSGRRLLLADVTENYRTVGDYLFVRGSAFLNTIILIILTLLTTLTVNPLAAYALSRFNLRRTESILLFLLATMAFPAAVTAIPGFILIRQLGLLNTFSALVLPGVANGLSIFILKGFFDALPRELYEAATIDGASEWQIFRNITLPMTTPILAVNALNAFICAYNSWEWALLVCQKQSHWTLAVWMYQMSRMFTATPWVIMAGFVIISIPTAVIFLLCQRIILRGIVLPSMK